ncbi:hypothetical protein BGX24_001793 [Mortierella sp. AD032]|nr:hypothetical protein BGX24_001793 [Mortierella sp. AD032]
MEDSRASHHNPYPGQGHPGPHSSDRYQGHPSSSSSSAHPQHPHQQHQSYQQQQPSQQHHPHVSYPKESSRGHHSQQSQPSSYSQQQQDPDAGAAWRSPITPTTTRKFNRMAIHEVLETHQQQQQHPHPYGEEDSPPYRRRGSPDDYPYSDPPASSNNSAAGAGSGLHPSSRSFGRSDMRSSDLYHRGVSPRYRQESPMPGSNSEDEDDDIRNSKKRRMVPGMLPSHEGGHQHSPPSSSPGGPPEVMDQLRTTMKMKQQQRALIVSRQGTQPSGQSQGQPQQQPSPQQSGSGRPSSSNGNGSGNGNNQPVTETTPSGLGVFHGSASFAMLNRRPQPSPKNPKNAKSLTIFAPSYSESSLSIQSAPLQPSQSHQAMSMGLRTSQPLPQRHQHHPYAQPGSFQQPLRSPRAVGHNKRPSRPTLRQPGSHAPGGEHSSSGTLPAPILSSHTGPLPSPMYPSTPFHSNLGNISNPKHMFMDTVSNLFDSVDSSRSLKYTLEEQIRKSAQLLQTLQASGTMIENLVRGQFKELEKGVIERFESEIEHLNARVRQLEEHQGLTPPPRKPKMSASTNHSTATPPTSKGATGTGAGAGVSLSTSASGPSPMETVDQATSSPTPPHAGSVSPKHGTLPTPPFNKNQDTSSAMEVEDEGEPETRTDSTFKGLGERVDTLERRKD